MSTRTRAVADGRNPAPVPGYGSSATDDANPVYSVGGEHGPLLLAMQSALYGRCICLADGGCVPYNTTPVKQGDGFK